MSIALVHPIQFLMPTKHQHLGINHKNHSFRLFCSSSQSKYTDAKRDPQLRTDYKAVGFFDKLVLNLFRQKMVEEIGWDSVKPDYDGLIEVANRLILGRTNSQAKDSAVRILRSLFPPLLLDLYRKLITPLDGGKVSAMMVARVTALSCQWLMGPCKVNSVELPDGKSWTSGVLVEKCKYLEESKCIGICINTCKLPTQEFFQDYMGVPLLMEPNFSDYSCQFKYGVAPLEPQHDSALREPCLEICPNASRLREISIGNNNLPAKCPKS